MRGNGSAPVRWRGKAATRETPGAGEARASRGVGGGGHWTRRSYTDPRLQPRSTPGPGRVGAPARRVCLGAARAVDRADGVTRRFDAGAEPLHQGLQRRAVGILAGGDCGAPLGSAGARGTRVRSHGPARPRSVCASARPLPCPPTRGSGRVGSGSSPARRGGGGRARGLRHPRLRADC